MSGNCFSWMIAKGGTNARYEGRRAINCFCSLSTCGRRGRNTRCDGGGELAEDVDGLSDLGWGKQRRFVLTGLREERFGI